MSTIQHARNVIRHLHLPGITPFTSAQILQQSLVSQFLAHKASTSSLTPPFPLPIEPQPTLLTFTPTPVYTTGRRELNTLSPTQLTHLKAPLRTPDNLFDEYADVVETLRGGQITFHGPGQLVIYPILSLNSISTPAYPRGISPRCYVHLLEATTIETLQSHCSVATIRTSDPGVWMPNGTQKIAAIGVHLRRNVASYGVAINVGTDLRWFERIVACGLEGKSMTSLEVEQGKGKDEALWKLPRYRLRCFQIAEFWCGVFRRRVWGDIGGVESVRMDEIERSLGGSGLIKGRREEVGNDDQTVNWKEKEVWRILVKDSEG